MTTYREDLEAAQLRIAHLQTELVDKDATITRLTSPPPVAVAATASNDTEPVVPELAELPAKSVTDDAPDADAEVSMGWWHVWPGAVLAVIGAVYVGMYGTALPSESTSVLMALGAAASTTMAIVYAIRRLEGGRSSIVQRSLTVLAGILALPPVIGLAFVLLPIVGMVIGIGSLVIGAVHVVVAVFRWIASSSAA